MEGFGLKREDEVPEDRDSLKWVVEGRLRRVSLMSNFLKIIAIAAMQTYKNEKYVKLILVRFTDRLPIVVCTRKFV